MTQRIDGMVMVATGIHPAIVARWSIVLRKAGIEFAATREEPADGIEITSSMDLWVEKRQAGTAKALIIDAESGRVPQHRGRSASSSRDTCKQFEGL